MRTTQYQIICLSLMLSIALIGCSGQTPSPTPGLLPKSTDSTLPIQEVWCQNLPAIVSYPTFYNGFIYTLQVIDRDAHLVNIVVFDRSGKILRERETQSFGTPGYWFVQDGYIITATSVNVTVFDAMTGEEIWQKKEATNKGMAIGDGKVFITTDGPITAYELNTGKRTWELAGPGRLSADAPYYVQTSNLLLLDQTTYRIVDAQSGDVKNETQRTFDFKEPPEFNQGVIYQEKYLRITPKALEILDVMTGKIIGAYEGQYNPLSLYPFIKEGLVYLNSFHAVDVVDIEQAEKVWRHSFSSDDDEEGLKVYGGPVVFKDSVYVILSDNSIRALDIRTGNETGHWQGRRVEKRWGIQSPYIPGFAIGEDRLYVSFGTNELCAFGN